MQLQPGVTVLALKEWVPAQQKAPPFLKFPNTASLVAGILSTNRVVFQKYSVKISEQISLPHNPRFCFFWPSWDVTQSFEGIKWFPGFQ